LVDFGLDKYAYLESPIHHWDPRYKLIGLMGLIFAFSFVQDLRLLPVLLGITLIVFVISRIPFGFLLTRLSYPGIFLLAVAIVLPLFSGTTILFHLGPLAVRQEGLLDLLLITVKFFCILTLGLVLFGSAPFLTTIKAIRALRLSPILADMMLLTYRYIFEIGHDLKTMEISMRLRNFRAGRLSLRGINALASVSGTLLIRSYVRSERIYKAMILRGYGHQTSKGIVAHSMFQAQHRDMFALGCSLLLAVLIVSVEIIL
jgi:cobalt/nickel transport system permease protein